MNRLFAVLALSLASLPGTLRAEPAPAVQAGQTYAALDADMAAWAKSHDVPGLAWGVVIDGKLAHLGTFGTQTVGADARPVSGDTGFRIASMSKAFTAYAIMLLRDEGKLRLDDPVAKYIPEVARWAPDITVADLLHHNAGFVTDDPWGDRHQPMPEADFTRLLKAGVPRTAAPETRYEYSNLGYAMLGRIVSNVGRRNFSQFIAERVFSPLGMASTTYEFTGFPAERRAMGYRWEDGAWRAEPVMAHGAFGAMGGITTSANDYARWVSFLLAAWPPASPEDRTGATIRALAYGGGTPQLRDRLGSAAPECKVAAVYAAGLIAGSDCVLGQVLFHGGGFPGYGSHMLLMPEAGAGVFVLTNRTYSSPSGPAWDAATRLMRAGLIQTRDLPVTPALDSGYATARKIWSDGGIEAIPAEALAMNFTMDRDASHWKEWLARIQTQSGSCDLSTPLRPTGALSGTFAWRCERGSLVGRVLLAPDFTPRLQALDLSFAISD